MTLESMSVYLFVTDEEAHPEAIESGEDDWWSCSKTTQELDVALVYVKGKGIVYQWLVTSNASPDLRWPYVCKVEHQRTFEPAISLEEIQSAVGREIWAPPHQNFRGFASIKVPLQAAEKIYDLMP